MQVSRSQSFANNPPTWRTSSSESRQGPCNEEAGDLVRGTKARVFWQRLLSTRLSCTVAWHATDLVLVDLSRNHDRVRLVGLREHRSPGRTVGHGRAEPAPVLL